MKRRFGSAT